MERLKKILYRIFVVFIGLLVILSFGEGLIKPSLSGYILGILYTGMVVGLCWLFVKYKKTENVKSGYILAGLMIVGMVLRILYVKFSQPIPISDYNTMYEGAKTLAAGNNPFKLFSYFHRFPHMTMFTYVNGMLYKFFGVNIFLTQMLSAALSVCSILIIYLVAERLFDRKAGLAAATIYTFLPPSIAYCAVFTSENFAMPFLILSMYFVVCAYKSADKKHIALYMFAAGAVLSVGCLFRGVWTFYLAAYLVSIFVLFAKKTKIISALALILAFVMVYQTVNLALYHSGITKYKMSESAVPYSVYMLVGFSFDTFGMYNEDDQNIFYEVDYDKEEMAHIVNQRLKQRISDNFWKIPLLMVIKTAIIFARGEFHSVFWSYEINGIEGEKPGLIELYKISSIYYLSMLIAAFYVLIKKKYMFKMLLPGLLILGFEAGLMLMEVQPRYPYSAVFAFALLASAIAFKEETKLQSEQEIKI